MDRETCQCGKLEYINSVPRVAQKGRKKRINSHGSDVVKRDSRRGLAAQQGAQNVMISQKRHLDVLCMNNRSCHVRGWG